AAALEDGAPVDEDEYADPDDAEDEPVSPSGPGEDHGAEALHDDHGAEALDQNQGAEALDENHGAEALDEDHGAEALDEGHGAKVIHRASLTREEKLALDSAEAGYRLAHTTSEAWTDEHFPTSPPEDPDPLASLGLRTQETLLDDELDDLDGAVCTIESSPEVDSAWPELCCDSSSIWAWRVCTFGFGSHMPKNPDQEDTYVPENSPVFHEAMVSLQREDVPENKQAMVATEGEGDVPENSRDLKQAMVATEGDVLENSPDLKQAMVATEGEAAEAEAPMASVMDESVSPFEAAAKAIAANGKKQSVEDDEAKPAKSGPKSKKARRDNDDETKPKGKRGPKKAAEKEEPKAKKSKAEGANEQDPKSKRKHEPKSKEAAANDQEPEPKRKPEPKSQEAATDKQEPKPKAKAKAKAKSGAMKKPAAFRPAQQEGDEGVVPPDGANDQGDELPHTFARRPMPTGAHGLNKYRRIVGAFKELVEPKLKSRQRSAAEDHVGP
ncbi:unnamed protein product, partial [Symbiodinium sp. CCMP2456]